MRLSSIVTASAVGVCLVACVFTYRAARASRRDAAAPPAEAPVAERAAPAPADDEIAHERGEIALLRSEVRSLLAQRAASPATGAPAPSPADDPRVNPEARARFAEKRHAYIAGIESSFRNEAVDPAWSAQTSGVIARALQADGVGLTARAVECRSQSCRVELVDDKPTHDASALPVFGIQVASALPTMAADRVESAGGDATLVLYLSKNRSMRSGASDGADPH
jgi:hypothetical protein